VQFDFAAVDVCPIPSTTNTADPLNWEDIFQAPLSGVTGSAVVLTKRIGALVSPALTVPTHSS
jgi:hypothetical protein